MLEFQCRELNISPLFYGPSLTSNSKLIFRHSWCSWEICVSQYCCCMLLFLVCTQSAASISVNVIDTKDIVMYINSPGGSVTAGMAIYDTMKHIRAPVSTVCVGLAASMSGFLLGTATKGKRFSLPNARIMIHQPMAETEGSQSDMDIQIFELLHHRAVLSSYLAYHTGQPLAKILKDTDRDFFMSAQQAKDYGRPRRSYHHKPPQGPSQSACSQLAT